MCLGSSVTAYRKRLYERSKDLIEIMTPAAFYETTPPMLPDLLHCDSDLIRLFIS